MEARIAAGRPPLVGNSDEEEDELESMMVLEMPPGFRFHPTDEEIITHYLLNKLMDRRFSSLAIADVDLNKCEPWDLPKKAKKTGEKEWFVFWHRDKKYPKGKRTNRATESGYWKATGRDKEIHMKGRRNCLVGMRKTLVFYKGRAPKGENTDWVMHEFRSEGNFSHYNFSSTAKEEWVVCRVFQKKTGTRTNPCVKPARIDSFVDHLLDIPTLSPSSSFLTTHDDDEDHEIKNELIICGSSSRPTPTTMSNKHQNYQNNFLLPPLCDYSIYPNPSSINSQIAHPDSVFTPPHQSSPSLAYQYDQDITAMYPTHFPCKGDDQLQNLRTCKMEPFSSSQNCVISHEMMTPVQYSKGDGIIESNKALFDDKQLDQCFSFSPNISDLDSLWSY